MNGHRQFEPSGPKSADMLQMQINKSDRNDAIGIARIMQTGWFKEVHVKDINSHSVRALLASRRCWSGSSAISRTMFAAC
jgi:hypothetical protein